MVDASNNDHTNMVLGTIQTIQIGTIQIIPAVDAETTQGEQKADMAMKGDFYQSEKKIHLGNCWKSIAQGKFTIE